MKCECAKCGKSSEYGITIAEGGVGYVFCRPCADTLNSLPTGTIQNFMGNKKESLVAKNMELARERRARGEKLWPKNAEG